jgi:hypothetical protein
MFELIREGSSHTVADTLVAQKSAFNTLSQQRETLNKFNSNALQTTRFE